MLRPELQALAKAGATVAIDGRVMEMHRNHPGTIDLLLRRCDVRQLDQGQPLATHPAIRTDHLWIRFPETIVQPDTTDFTGVPYGLRQALQRRTVTLLEQIRLVGRCGFYSHGNGALGIGITEVVPTIGQARLQTFVLEAQDCFLSHPWKADCLQVLEDVIDRAVGILRDEVVVLTHPAADVIRTLERVRLRCQRDHAAEAKARAGHRRARAAAHQPAVLPMLGQGPAAGDLLAAVRRRSGVEQLQAQAVIRDADRRRYGRLH